jgi:hypothetical protein
MREARRQHPDYFDHTAILYADDGLLTGTTRENIQQYLDTIVELFERIGLKTNVDKTKSLIGRAEIHHHRICSPVYSRLFGGDAPSYMEYTTQIINCTLCNKPMQRRSLPRHLQQQHDTYARPTLTRSFTKYPWILVTNV